MRMAYVITKMNALTTNITLSHLDTSSAFALTRIVYFLCELRSNTTFVY